MVVTTSTLLLWLPFLLKWSAIGHLKFPHPLSMYDLYKHWDGILYVVVAKTFYNIRDSVLLARPLGLPIPYFAAHLPLYPLLIKLLSPLGYLRGMLLIPVGFAILYATFFYKFGFGIGLLFFERKVLVCLLIRRFSSCYSDSRNAPFCRLRHVFWREITA